MELNLRYRTFLSGIFLSLFLYPSINAQVGIGTTSPDPSSILDMSSTSSGLLVPRMTQAERNAIVNPATGLLVFQTDVTPGHYAWDGTVWQLMPAGTPSIDWKLSGNTSTNPGTGVGQHYFGTTDNRPLVLGTFGIERMRLLANGRVSINNTNPLAGDRLTVTGAAAQDAINGYSTTTGTGVYGENTGSGAGVFGNGVQYGVFGQSGSATGWAVRARNANILGTGILANGTNSASTYLTSGTGVASNGVDGLFAYGRSATGTGVIATGNNDATIYTLTNGSGVAGTGFDTGVFGITTSLGAAYGGYFATDSGDYAYVGGWDGTTQIKINGTGTVATIVKDVNEQPIKMFAPEAPEILFQDFGIGKLNSGVSQINLDPNLSKNIRVDAQYPLKVFIQLEGECNGVYVTHKSANGFTVRELQGGSSNVEFSWSVVATRANEEIVARNGATRISDNSVRFPSAPGPMKLKKSQSSTLQDSKTIKTIKQMQ